MLLLLAQGHLENPCSRSPLKISDKGALPSHCWGEEQVTQGNWVPSGGLTLITVLPQIVLLLCDLTRFEQDRGLRRGQKENLFCLLAPHSHDQSPFQQCLLPFETFVSVSSSRPVVRKEGCLLCSLKLIFLLYAVEY